MGNLEATERYDDPGGAPAERGAGTAVDRFEILRVLGRGGMGVTYAARDPQLGRTVALKLVTAFSTLDATERLLREARALAMVSHPNVVTVFEAGTTKGEVWIAMELVSGGTLGAWQREERRGWRDILARYLDAARGLAAAHAAGLVHRDFKPENVLLDGDRPKVCDFGLARRDRDLSIPPGDEPPHELGATRATAEEPHETPLPAVTRHGAIVGTPAYMSPEQHFGHAVDARTDQFSLCVALWEALYGERPFRDDGDELKFLARLARGQVSAPRDRRGVPAWLEAIVRRGLSLDPDERWPSMDALIAAAIAARDEELVVRPRRRRRLLAAGAGLGLAVVATGAIVIARRGEDSVRQEADHAASMRLAADTLAEARRLLPTDPTAAVAALEKLPPGSPVWAEARAIVADAAGAGISHRLPAPQQIDALAFSSDGRRLAAGGPDGVVRVWDLGTWTPVELTGHAHPITGVGFAGEDVVSVDTRGLIKQWQLSTRTARDVRTTTTERLRDAAVSFDGQRVLLNGDTVKVVERDNSERDLGRLSPAAFTLGGTAVVGIDRGIGKLVRVELATGERTILAAKTVPAVVVADCGGFSAASGLMEKGHVRVHEGEVRRDLRTGHVGPVTRIACAPDGTMVVASASLDYSAIAEAADPEVVVMHGWDIERLRGHQGDVRAVAIARDGRRVASAGSDGIRVWDRRGKRRAGQRSSTAAAGIVADGHIFVGKRGPRFVSDDRTLEIVAWPEDMPPEGLEMRTMTRTDLDDDKVFEEITGPAAKIVALVASADRRHFATLDDKQQVIAWDAATGGRVLGRGGTRIAMSSDGARIAVANEATREIRAWTRHAPSWVGARRVSPVADVATVAVLDDDARGVGALAYAPDGSLAASFTTGVLLYGKGPLRGMSTGVDDVLTALAFTPDGATLVAGGHRRVVYTWRVPEAGGPGGKAAVARTWTGHDDPIVALAMSPHGDEVASGGAKGGVRRWRLGDGASEAMRGHTGAITMLAFRRDGALLSVSADRTARVWAGVYSRTVRLAHGGVFGEIEAHRIIAIDQGGTVIESREDDIPVDEVSLRAWLSSALR